MGVADQFFNVSADAWYFVVCANLVALLHGLPALMARRRRKQQDAQQSLLEAGAEGPGAVVYAASDALTDDIQEPNSRLLQQQQGGYRRPQLQHRRQPGPPSASCCDGWWIHALVWSSALLATLTPLLDGRRFGPAPSGLDCWVKGPHVWFSNTLEIACCLVAGYIVFAIRR